jgi:hypothetical protein
MYLTALSDKELHFEYAKATADYFKVRDGYTKGMVTKDELQLKKSYLQSVVNEIKRRDATAN